MRVPVSFVIPTLNEERNLEAALKSVTDWTEAVFVLDSFSDDRTCEIVREHGLIGEEL